MRHKPLDFNHVRELAMKLPDVEASSIHGAPSLKVRGKLLACPALHRTAEPNTLAVRIGLDQRATMLTAEPDQYYVTDHYLSYPTVLVRLSRIDRDSMEALLRMSWQFVTTKSGPRATRGASRSGSRTTDRR